MTKTNKSFTMQLGFETLWMKCLKKNNKLHLKSAALVWLDFMLFNHKNKACVLLMLLVECIQFNQRMMNASICGCILMFHICQVCQDGSVFLLLYLIVCWMLGSTTFVREHVQYFEIFRFLQKYILVWKRNISTCSHNNSKCIFISFISKREYNKLHKISFVTLL